MDGEPSEKPALTPEEVEQGIRWFEQYMERLENKSVRAEPQKGVRYRCPCCNYKTLQERGGFDICPVCFWEDDGQDEQDADTMRGGPNGSLSLTQARANYHVYGACKEGFVQNVRPPSPKEK